VNKLNPELKAPVTDFVSTLADAKKKKSEPKAADTGKATAPGSAAKRPRRRKFTGERF
jgi:hypothetical protein